MKILHGTWVPQAEETFIQPGQFCLWVETSEPSRPSRKKAGDRPTHHLPQAALTTLLEEIGIKPPAYRSIEQSIKPYHWLLPTAADSPLPSLELSRYLEQDASDTFDYQLWAVDCYVTPALTTLTLLNELHFIALYNLAEVQLGADLLFWYHYTQSLKQVLQRDQYIPAMRYRELAPASKTRSKRKTAAQKRTKANIEPSAFEIYPTWDLIGERYETELQTFVDYMPLSCTAAFEEKTKATEFYEREPLLRHFSECFLAELVSKTGFPQNFRKKIEGSLLEHCIFADLGNPWTSPEWKEQYQQWQTWRDRITRSQTAIPFHIYFHLQEPDRPE